ncbi:hypothetical protein BDW22DRAFT_1378788 [Trametopsis cervina]|nr:hypothetical protein BDW22DRAFT_1378788 [Trametopsis cervina]
MADGVMLFDAAQTHAADTEFFVRRGMTKGYQLLSLLAPPVYAAAAITRYGRGHLSVNRILRATWIGGSAGMSHRVVGGGALEYARSRFSDHEKLRRRRLVSTYDTSSLRADDHATIGGILFAVITPALFWKRANSLNLILGGAGIGSAVGVLAHHVRAISGDHPPVVEIPAPTNTTESKTTILPAP